MGWFHNHLALHRVSSYLPAISTVVCIDWNVRQRPRNSMAVRNGLRTSQKTTFGEEWRDDIFRNQSLYHRFLVVGRDGNRMSYMIFTRFYQFFLTERVPAGYFKIAQERPVWFRWRCSIYYRLANGIRVGLRGWGDVPTPLPPLKGSWIFLQGKTESQFQQAGSKKNQISDFQTTNIISWSYPIQFWILLDIYPLSHNAKRCCII